MNRQIFETWVETQLAPTLQPGNVVILDNLSSHKSEKAKAVLKERGAWFLFLPPYTLRLLSNGYAAGTLAGSAPTSTRSRWPSQSSKPTSGASAPELSTRSGAPSATSATSTHPTNAGTISKPQGMRQIKRSML